MIIVLFLYFYRSLKGIYNEKDVSAKQIKARQKTRISQKNVNQTRQEDNQSAQKQGTTASRSLNQIM